MYLSSVTSKGGPVVVAGCGGGCSSFVCSVGADHYYMSPTAKIITR